MPLNLQNLLRTKRLTQAEIEANRQRFYRTALEDSSYLDAGNFSKIHVSDIERLFHQYDQGVLAGLCRQSLGDTPLTFRLSSRMTSAGGTTTHQFKRQGNKKKTISYEIAISTTLLFQTFRDVERPIQVSGVTCRDRLEALQRVMEHEITHLCEMLAWGDSQCSQARFQTIARTLYGHRDHRHGLITQHERAATRFNIRSGDRVTFQVEGRVLQGFVNRITRRATVLVEDPKGSPYQDGKRYSKYYVPLPLLKRAQ
ncbi:hypothetical protein [Lignipirellula cremea]|uniref:SprT-like family protein n=1 Tax=Lignipirellula cremea TaxID=2528010 RepID=A0A518E246_9BACT|nr:hypothetical protein [Lignipirellula cremea]QDU98132.1 hypothetical protein Pla8534_59930 [Lignipirellula cremea]